MRARLFLMIVLASLLAACAAPTAVPTAEPTPEKFSVTDALGRVVEFERLPERVVIAGKATTLLIDTAYIFPRAGQVVVAVEERLQSAQNFMPLLDPQWSDKTQLELDSAAEQIAPYQPDLVILKTYMAEKVGQPLEQLGIKVLYLDLETTETFYRDLGILGTVFGDPERAAQVTEYYRQKVDDVLAGTASLSAEERPSVLLLQYSDKGGAVSFNVPPAGWLQTYLVGAAGGNPVWASEVTGSGWTVVSFEQIAAWNPQVVLIVDYKLRAPEIVEQLKADPQWALLPAVTNDKLYAFPGDFLSWDQPDSRWVLGLTWLAHTLHPALTPGYDIQAEALDFYSKMYGMDKASIEANIYPLLEAYLP